VALEKAAGEDIFFIPEVHFATETPELDDDEGWCYRVRSIIWFRECRKCGVCKERGGFTPQEWNKKQPVICARCDTRKGVTRASSGKTRNVRKRVKNSPNLQARRPRAVHGKEGAARDVTSESEEDETEGVKCGARKYGVSHEATTRVEGRWCTPYRRSRKSSILNLRI
jgi:hypothetical protein